MDTRTKAAPLVPRFIRMFKCATARLSRPCGRHWYLIIGFKRNTKNDSGQWYRDGKPWNFTYTAEKVIASGRTLAALVEGAKRYKKLCKKEEK
jgi:hypothetical protein